MVDTLIVFFFKNTLLVSFVFWILSIVGQFFFNRYEYKFKEDYYECGFKTTSDINFNLNFSFFISAIFLILYDIEVIFLIPFLFNYTFCDIKSLFLVLLLVFTIYITLVLDVISLSIDWNY